MKNPKTVWSFVGGTLLGAGLMLCVGAAETTPPATKIETAVKPPPAPLQALAYPNGATGFFDPNSGRLYIYDNDQNKCYLVRQLTTLGQPMMRP